MQTTGLPSKTQADYLASERTRLRRGALALTARIDQSRIYFVRGCSLKSLIKATFRKRFKKKLQRPDDLDSDGRPPRMPLDPVAGNSIGSLATSYAHHQWNGPLYQSGLQGSMQSYKTKRRRFRGKGKVKRMCVDRVW